MKRFAVVQHSYSEFLGLIETQLEKRDIGFIYFRPFLGSELPGSGLQFDALFLLGGPMSPLDRAELSWLDDETRVIGAFRQAKRPIIGIGLGAMMMADYEGARIEATPRINAYWTRARKTAAGEGDPLAEAVDGEEVLVWAPGAATLPSGLEPILVDEAGNWIAFRPEPESVGMLFRPEMKPGMIEDIMMEEDRETPANVLDLMERMRARWADMQRLTDKIVVALVTSSHLMQERHKPPVFSLKVEK